ncbi:hypothetical protein [Weissella sagaensis]|uniref:hypothetical protein n=1 Tax=Weissella sagaensis TaxID=2559928 RepID=UPI0013EB42EE|nr:hypothetical protein [Weissella sagaensis]
MKDFLDVNLILFRSITILRWLVTYIISLGLMLIVFFTPDMEFTPAIIVQLLIMGVLGPIALNWVLLLRDYRTQKKQGTTSKFEQASANLAHSIGQFSKEHISKKTRKNLQQASDQAAYSVKRFGKEHLTMLPIIVLVDLLIMILAWLVIPVCSLIAIKIVKGNSVSY